MFLLNSLHPLTTPLSLVRESRMTFRKHRRAFTMQEHESLVDAMVRVTLVMSVMWLGLQWW